MKLNERKKRKKKKLQHNSLHFMDLKHTHGSYQNSIMNMRIKDFFYYNVINVVVFQMKIVCSLQWFYVDVYYYVLFDALFLGYRVRDRDNENVK